MSTHPADLRTAYDAAREFPHSARPWDDLTARDRRRYARTVANPMPDTVTPDDSLASMIRRRDYFLAMASRAREPYDRRICIGTARYINHQIVRTARDERLYAENQHI